MRLPAVLSACLFLTACVHPGRPEVSTLGSGHLKSGGAFTLVGSGPEGAVAEPVASRVGDALKAAGLHAAQPPEAPDYLVHVAWATGSSKVGGFIPPEEGSKAQPDWRVRGVKSGPFTVLSRNGQFLTLQVVDGATGKQVRRIVISRRSYSADPNKAVVRIAEALTTSLTTP